MQLLRYNEFTAKGLDSKLRKVEQMLQAGDFKSAEVKKIRHMGYFRAKLDRENRLLFKFAKHQGETYILLLEVIPNHAYDKSRLLRGAAVKEDHFSEVPGPDEVEAEGKIHFYPDSPKVRKELNKRTQASAKFAVLTLDKSQKARVAQNFQTPLVFTIQEAKGLEYENIILVNFISDHDGEFRNIAKGVSKADLPDENLRYSRAKDKTNKDQEAYKFYINSLYVAFTRAVKNVHILEANTKNELLQLLGVIEAREKVEIEEQASDETEWLEEARRLELQGKTEQAEAIRARLRGVEFVSLEEAELLEEKVFAPETQHTDKDVERLFLFARSRRRIPLIQRLHEVLGSGPAKQYLGVYRKAQQQLTNHVRKNNRKLFIRRSRGCYDVLPEAEVTWG